MGEPCKLTVLVPIKGLCWARRIIENDLAVVSHSVTRLLLLHALDMLPDVLPPNGLLLHVEISHEEVTGRAREPAEVQRDSFYILDHTTHLHNLL